MKTAYYVEEYICCIYPGSIRFRGNVGCFSTMEKAQAVATEKYENQPVIGGDLSYFLHYRVQETVVPDDQPLDDDQQGVEVETERTTK